MSKNNIRSFRFSDEVAAILERQPGKNLNEKFESLILWKSLEKDALEAETVTLRQQTEKAREELKRVQMVVSSLETIRRALEPLEILASGINVTQIASEGEAAPLDSASDVLQKPLSRRKPARNVTQKAPESEAFQEDVLQAHNTDGNNPQQEDIYYLTSDKIHAILDE